MTKEQTECALILIFACLHAQCAHLLAYFSGEWWVRCTPTLSGLAVLLSLRGEPTAVKTAQCISRAISKHLRHNASSKCPAWCTNVQLYTLHRELGVQSADLC